jgi:hypothetical protein
MKRPYKEPSAAELEALSKRNSAAVRGITVEEFERQTREGHPLQHKPDPELKAWHGARKK